MTRAIANLNWQRLGPVELEREYSPSSCLDGPIDPYIDAYVSRSAEQYDLCQGEGFPIHEIRYGPLPANTIDLVMPDGGAPAPVVVFIHGGYWQQLSKQEAFFGAKDCLDNGLGFATVDYTLAPHVSLDEIVDECRTAVAKIASAAPALGIDATQIVIAGSSAGAHLAAMVALEYDAQPPLAGCCLLSGVFELEPLIGTSINDAVGLDDVAARRNSPALKDLSGFPPSVIAYGDNETSQFKQQSDRFAALLEAAATNVSVVEVAGRNHFDVVFDLCDQQTELGRRTIRLAEG